ncbi:MAG TPA: universal stress protein [Gemmatimonadaceae bacterium]|nr:universal stress protein [Gemmatimonadaceae bacterium]
MIVVATDGREQSDGAVRAGVLFGEPAGWRIVSAAPLLHNFAPELDLGITAQALEVLRDQQRQSVQDQLRRVRVEDARVEVDIAASDPALATATVARRENASLVICGLGRHRIVDRLLGDETALAIIRVSEHPVLAVPDDFAHRPRCAVVGVDFSEDSLRAIELVTRFTTSSATIHLVNVAPHEHVLHLVPGGFNAYEEHARAQLARVIEGLGALPDVLFQPVVRQGDPGSELLRYAAEHEDGMIAVGTRGLGFVARLLLGSVATKVIRASPVPVLTVPRRPGTRRLV